MLARIIHTLRKPCPPQRRGITEALRYQRQISQWVANRPR